MNNKTGKLSAHPVSPSLAPSPQEGQICRVRTMLEMALISPHRGRLLLLLEEELMDELVIRALECLFASHSSQRILLLVPATKKAVMMKRWEDKLQHPSLFSVTALPPYAQEARLSITTVFDLQVDIGVDLRQPFFQAFDAIVLSDVPSNPGPVWSQIVELFAIMNTRVIGFSSHLREEEGALLFEQVIDTKGPPMNP